MSMWFEVGWYSRETGALVTFREVSYGGMMLERCMLGMCIDGSLRSCQSPML
jgi:hypothetical protein